MTKNMQHHCCGYWGGCEMSQKSWLTIKYIEERHDRWCSTEWQSLTKTSAESMRETSYNETGMRPSLHPYSCSFIYQQIAKKDRSIIQKRNDAANKRGQHQPYLPHETITLVTSGDRWPKRDFWMHANQRAQDITATSSSNRQARAEK